MTMVVQTTPAGLAMVAQLAERFPTVKIALDHCGRPDLERRPAVCGLRGAVRPGEIRQRLPEDHAAHLRSRAGGAGRRGCVFSRSW
jgi:hypothetical protein